MTRSDLQFHLVDTFGGWMNLVGKDGVTWVTTNASLSGPISSGLTKIAYLPSSESNPTDADVGMVPDSYRDQLKRACSIALLEAILGNWSAVDEKVATNEEQKLIQIAALIVAKIKTLQEELAKPFSVGSSQPQVGWQNGGSPVPNQPRWVQYPR